MPDRNPPIHIVAISGSLREVSYTRCAVSLALEGAAGLGATTQLIDLRDYELIMVDGRDSSAYPEGVKRLREHVARADGIILGTPSYHSSVSGVLKNALDLMGFAEFEGKIVGLVGVAGGRVGAIDALDSLRTIGRSLHAWVIPDQVSIPQAFNQFDADGQPKDKELRDRLLRLGQQVARFAVLHTARETLDFLREWEQAPENPGGNQ